MSGSTRHESALPTGPRGGCVHLFGDLERPQGKLTRGKFVVAGLHGALHVAMAPREAATYHADIVAELCTVLGVEARRDSENGKVMPETGEVLGGGHFELDDSEHRLHLYGRSLAYGPYPPRGLASMLRCHPRFAGYEVVLS